MEKQCLLRDGRYGALCDQIRMGEVTVDNLHGKKDRREKLAKDPIFARAVMDTITESGYKYFDSVSEDDSLKFEMMMRICDDIIKENPDMAQNITPLLHKIKNIPPKFESHAEGLITLAETFVDIVQQKSVGTGVVSSARKNAAKNVISIMENLSLEKDLYPTEVTFIRLANKIQERDAGFTTEEREAMDKAYLNFRKNNPYFDDEYLSHNPDLADKKYMGNYISRKKEQIRQRLQNRDNQISGVVSADRIAEAQINGNKYEQINPKDDKLKEPSDKLKERVLNKMLENKQPKR